MAITLEQIEVAKKRLEPIILKTELAHSRSCSERVGTNTYLKYENQQLTGSFKIRGALNKILSLPKSEKSLTVIAASAGNHAQGVAYSARHRGFSAKIVMPIHTPIVKIQATQAYGAEVLLRGEGFDESYAYAQKLAKEHGYIFIHPFEDEQVIAGQGTIGLDILEVMPDIDSIILAIGGGGLIGGVASAIKQKKPSCKVYGVVAEEFPGVERMFHQQEYVPCLTAATIAEGIAVKTPSKKMYDDYIKKYVDDIVCVSDSQIAESVVFLLERAKTVVEGAGAISLAAAIQQKNNWDLGKKTCVVLSGGNIDLNLVSKIIERGLSQAGRIARIIIIAGDKPGVLTDVTKIIANEGANILEVQHDRYSPGLKLREAAIHVLLETKSSEHQEIIIKAIERNNYRTMRPSI